MVLTEVVNLVVRVLVLGDCAIVTLPAVEMSRITIDKVMLLNGHRQKCYNSLVCMCRSHIACSWILGCWMLCHCFVLIVGRVTRQTGIPDNVYSHVHQLYEDHTRGYSILPCTLCRCVWYLGSHL